MNLQDLGDRSAGRSRLLRLSSLASLLSNQECFNGSGAWRLDKVRRSSLSAVDLVDHPAADIRVCAAQDPKWLRLQKAWRCQRHQQQLGWA